MKRNTAIVLLLIGIVIGYGLQACAIVSAAQSGLMR